MASSGFHVRPLDLSIEDIDRLLVTGDSESIRATVGARHAQHAPHRHPPGEVQRARGGPVPVYTRDDLSPSMTMARPAAEHQGWGAGARHEASAPASAHGAGGMLSTCREEEIAVGAGGAGEYGATGIAQMEVQHPDLGTGSRGYRRIERVTLTLGIIWLAIFCCAFMVEDRPKIVPDAQQLSMLPPFGCHAFLCPTSTACVESAAHCPEGNPFILPGGYYRELITCGGRAGLCDCSNNPRLCHAPMSLEEQRRLAFTFKSKEGVESCVAFVCPASGRCVDTPLDCREGSPFLHASSLYAKDADAARLTLGPVLQKEVAANQAKRDAVAKAHAAAAKAKAEAALQRKAAAAAAAAIKEGHAGGPSERTRGQSTVRTPRGGVKAGGGGGSPGWRV
ncbi:hypothetical protein T484DRAFT_2378634 [Baffinella frigidus]|nr:hypothetical protein T484DRAFT_2378634 [Cryptophyta sp. CCMP2293]